MRSAALPWMMLSPPPIARPFGQVDEPIRTVSASSFQKKVGLKISMNGRSAVWAGGWAVCAPDGAADAAKVKAAISNEPVDFMMPLLKSQSPFLPAGACRGGASFARGPWPRPADAAAHVGNPARCLAKH
jgi:hypothetical protein